ncbi:MAG TPA: DUF4157 domain-containing protein [Longimicrobium sp.]|nr:DUF4157 domain-containing protein [Longimicrobium sp.]
MRIAKRATPKAQARRSTRGGGSGSAAHPLLLLQAQLGNRATRGLLQARLASGDDAARGGADPAADGELQRCAACEERERRRGASAGAAPLKPEKEKKEEEDRDAAGSPLIRRGPASGAAAAPAVGPQLESTVRASQGRGDPLPPDARGFFEPRFGADFSGVRVHTDARAGAAARELNARAFTVGNDIYFGGGEYRPGSSGGRHLLGHELTHVVQQGGGEARRAPAEPATVRRQAAAPAEPALPAASVSAAVDAIVDALDGYTSAADSALILRQFQGRGAGAIQAILTELKGRAAAHGQTAAGMIQWLLGDMTAEDSRTLRTLLLDAGVVADLAPVLAAEIYDRLSGYTSEADSHEIYARLSQLSGTALDVVLVHLERVGELDAEAMGRLLLGDLDRVSAERTRRHFLSAGGPRAVGYGVRHTAMRIYDLLQGYTSMADSAAIRRIVEESDAGALEQVQARLDLLTRVAWGQSAEDALMEDMSREDYEAIRARPGLTLRKYDYPGRWWEKVMTAAEWGLVVAEWVVCGLVGVVTGIIAWLWDFVVLVADIAKVVWNLLWSLVYALSGGAAGSENWLAVKDFFVGIGAMFSQPGAVIAKAWEDVKLQFTTIEGPLADCRRAEFIVRKFVYTAINVVLFVKGAAAGARKVGGWVKGAPKPPVAPRVPPGVPHGPPHAPHVPSGPGRVPRVPRAPRFPSLAAARQWAGETFALAQAILADMSFEAIERLMQLPEWAVARFRPLAMATKRWLLGCASPCKVDVDAILAYLKKLTPAARAGAKALDKVQDVLDALPPGLNRTLIEYKLNKHPVYMLAIRRAGLTNLDFGALKGFLVPADANNALTAYQTFTRYVTSLVPVRMGPDIRGFNQLMADMVALRPRVAAALKGPMFETFAKVHLGRFRNIRFGRATFTGQGLSRTRTSDGFIEWSQALWDFKHTFEKVPPSQAQDYLRILSKGLVSTEGKTVRSINYLFPTREAAEANKHLQQLGFFVHYVTPPSTVTLLP